MTIRTATLVFALILVISVKGFAMILTLPLPELASQAQVVAVVKIGPGTPMPKPDGSQLPWLAHGLVVERVFKGDVQVGQSLPLPLPDRSASETWEEDAVALPPAGERALVFLTPGSGELWRVINGPQGIWPLDTGTDIPCGMGTGKTMSDVEQACREGEK